MAINNMTATGNVGKDAELRYTQNGTAIGDFSLPVKQGYGDHEKTAWVKCVMIGKFAEAYIPSIKKGCLVSVNGEFYLEEWEKDGIKHVKPCIKVNQIQPEKKAESQQKPTQAQSEPVEPDDIPF